MKRLLLLTLLVVGCSTPATIAPVSRDRVVIDGQGAEKSAPVALRGDYAVGWYLGNARDGCLFSVTLRGAGAVDVYELLANDLSDKVSGTTNLYGLEAARYFVDATMSTCSKWQVILTPS